MSRTDRSRPTRRQTWIAIERDAQGNVRLAYDEFGNPVTEVVDREVGHRKGLNPRKSQTAYHRTASNRLDRRDARRQLRRDPDSVSNRARKNDSVWMAT
jgi:hypothetical protein